MVLESVSHYVIDVTPSQSHPARDQNSQSRGSESLDQSEPPLVTKRPIRAAGVDQATQK